MASKKTTYLYIDDEKPEVIDPYIRQLVSASTNIKINLNSPRPWDEQINFIKSQEYDGIILDYRLDESVMWEVEENNKKKAQFRAEDLAQRLRTLGTENKIPNRPIILWSTDQRIQRSAIKRDDTSDDLFDYRVIKDNLKDDDFSNDLASKLISISKGYDILNSFPRKRNAFKMLGWSDEQDFIDNRLISYLSPDLKPPAHNVARTLLKFVLETNGVLIDKQTLAARLGIDLEKSKDFDQLIKGLPKNVAYKGVFHEGWERWWSYLIEEWWNSLTPPSPLRAIKAEERVKFLKEELKLKNLFHYSPEKSSYSSKYWAICHILKTPLSTIDGFIIDFQDKLPWQDNLYVSFEAVEKRLLKEKSIKIDPIDLDRLDMAKKMFKDE